MIIIEEGLFASVMAKLEIEKQSFERNRFILELPVHDQTKYKEIERKSQTFRKKRLNLPSK